MRRLTWMRYNHFIGTDFTASRLHGLVAFDGYFRQPMQRTEYYMPWGVVTVDELSKMEYDRSPTILACFDARDDDWWWLDDEGNERS
jgi:hypothetical protein